MTLGNGCNVTLGGAGAGVGGVVEWCGGGVVVLARSSQDGFDFFKTSKRVVLVVDT